MIRRRVLHQFALAIAYAVAASSVPVTARAQGEALSLTEVLDMRRRGVPSRRILRNAQEYCVSFAVNDSVERALVAVGADTALIAGIRQSCVVATPLMHLPAGVLLDDNLSAMSGLPWFNASDRLCSVRPDSLGLRVENRRGAMGCAIGYPFDLATTNVRIELTIADLHGVTNAMAALGFGRDGYSWDQYSFGITKDDRFELCLSVAGRCKSLVAQKRVTGVSMAGSAVAVTGTATADTVRRGDVRIAVELRGRVIALYIDDERVGTHTAPDAVTGGLSLGVGSRSTAIFKRLRVQRLDEAAAARD